jgi:hypothetical protein
MSPPTPCTVTHLCCSLLSFFSFLLQVLLSLLPWLMSTPSFLLVGLILQPELGGSASLQNRWSTSTKLTVLFTVTDVKPQISHSSHIYVTVTYWLVLSSLLPHLQFLHSPRTAWCQFALLLSLDCLNLC